MTPVLTSNILFFLFYQTYFSHRWSPFGKEENIPLFLFMTMTNNHLYKNYTNKCIILKMLFVAL